MTNEPAKAPARGSKQSEKGLGELPFEKALAELEEIVRQLEGGRVSLEDSIAIFERGELLKRHCENLLKLAEARIDRITLGPDGKPAGTAPLDPP